MRSLRARLFWAVAALLILLGIVQALSLWFTTEAYHREIQQRLSGEVAEHIVHENILLEKDRVDQAALEHVFHMMMVINPSLELYLLDPEGKILAYSAPPGKVRLKRVALEPVKAFIAGPRDRLIEGENPRHPDAKAGFSAAAIEQDGDLQGYLYIVLGGDLYHGAVERLGLSLILRRYLGAWLAMLLISLALGAWILHRLTARLRRLSARVQLHQAEFLGESPQGIHRDDEIANLDHSLTMFRDRLRDFLDEKERLALERRELISNVSHDLRTPIAALRGYLETLELKKGLSEEEKRSYLHIALKHAERLSRLVDELFELTRLERPEPDVQPEYFSLQELVLDNVGRFRLQAEQRNVDLRCTAAPEAPYVWADLRLVERAIVNLVENALRFTQPQGRVNITVDTVEDRVRLEVSDNGCGIAPEDIPHVFERYYRARRTEHSSTGLGLAIVKRIAEIHGSAISVESTEGQGATFGFFLPTLAS